jgi:hypothetical protein
MDWDVGRKKVSGDGSVGWESEKREVGVFPRQLSTKVGLGVEPTQTFDRLWLAGLLGGLGRPGQGFGGLDLGHHPTFGRVLW